MRVWTPSQIHALPEFGNEHGWFYGIVRDGARLRVAEIIPGVGYATAWPIRSLQEARWLVRDVLRRKAAA